MKLQILVLLAAGLTKVAFASDFYLVVPMKGHVTSSTPSSSSPPAAAPAAPQNQPCSLQEKVCSTIGELAYDGQAPVGLYAGADSTGAKFIVAPNNSGNLLWPVAQTQCAQTFGAGWSLISMPQVRQLAAQHAVLNGGNSWSYFWTSTPGVRGPLGKRFADGLEAELTTDGFTNLVRCARSL